MLLDDAGWLGLGINTPLAPLHIEQSGASSAKIILSDSDAPRQNGIRVSNSDELVVFSDDTAVGTASAVRIHVDGAETARFTGAGLRLKGGDNDLDSYDEGTFTVKLVRNGSSANGVNVTAYYVKIGRLVHIVISTTPWAMVNPGTSYSSNQSVTIEGNLPFAPIRHGGGAPSHVRTLANDAEIRVAWQSNSTVIYLNRVGINNGYYPTNNVVTDSSQTNITLMFTGTYYTNS